MNTVKFRYHYKKIVDFEGYLNIPLDEFKDAKEIAECDPENPECGECEAEEDWSEMEYIGASCDMCAKEFKDASEVNLEYDGQFCKDCSDDDKEEAKRGRKS